MSRDVSARCLETPCLRDTPACWATAFTVSWPSAFASVFGSTALFAPVPTHESTWDARPLELSGLGNHCSKSGRSSCASGREHAVCNTATGLTFLQGGLFRPLLGPGDQS